MNSGWRGKRSIVICVHPSGVASIVVDELRPARENTDRNSSEGDAEKTILLKNLGCAFVRFAKPAWHPKFSPSTVFLGSASGFSWSFGLLARELTLIEYDRKLQKLLACHRPTVSNFKVHPRSAFDVLISMMEKSNLTLSRNDVLPSSQF